ncbi:MAG: SDR family oxidoreductase [Bacteroidetes bacterium]|nr:SDR family oxidoreductase [Bacteroidota bacterium]
MDISLNGKNAIVCGSSQGIGKAVALELALSGTNITLVARNENALEEVRSELANDGNQEHRIAIVDFEHPDKVKETAAKLVEERDYQILVNNTGGPASGPITEAKTEDFIKAFSNHLICNHILTQAVIPGMKKTEYGRIINIISTSVKQPIKGLGVSNTTRGAVASWARTMAMELGEFGITVNNVLPGSTKTKRLNSLFEAIAERESKTLEEIKNRFMADIPAGRFGDPSEIAAVVAFLASPAASYVNGISIAVDGGRTLSL